MNEVLHFRGALVEGSAPADVIVEDGLIAEIGPGLSRAGATVVDRSSVLTTHLAEVVRAHASRLLSFEDVRTLTDAVKRSHPVVVEELMPAQLSLGEVQRVLQALLEEGVSIRDLVRIFEALSLRARVSKDTDGLVEAARAVLGPAVVAPYVSAGSLPVISFEPGLEQRLLEGLRVGDEGAFLTVDVDLAQGVLTQMAALARQVEDENLTPVLACAPQLRPAVRRMVSPSLPRLPVVSYSELGGPVQIRSVGVVTGQPAAVGV